MKKRIKSTKSAGINNSVWEAQRIKLLSILFISLVLSLLLLTIKYEIVNGVYSLYCEPIRPGDYASETVKNAVNLHHLIRENPNNEHKLLELLSDRVIWFRKSKTVPIKERIGKYSLYDNFCLGTQPEFTLNDEMGNNYQMTFVGFHRYREPDSLFCNIENYYCEIESGKIKEIYSVPIGAINKSRINKVNVLYQYFFPIALLIVLVIVSIIHFLTTVPEAVFSALFGVLKKVFRL